MSLIRLQKFLSDCGVMSRRSAEAAIQSGSVTVNGERVDVGTKIDPDADTVKVGNKTIKPALTRKRTYIMLNKPRGYLTTMSDDRGRKCVAELVADVGCRVYPIGRLDFDSEGLLLFTDDGALANKLMHPSGHVPKVYRVKTDSPVDRDVIKRLCQPIEIDGRMTSAAECETVSQNERATVISVTLYEGRNRQIRRLFESLGLNVLYLRRVAIGSIKLGNLKPGEWRRLTADQVSYLTKYKSEKQGNRNA